MLQSLAILCLYFTLITAKPSVDVDNSKVDHRLESVEKLLEKFVQHSKGIRQYAASRLLEVHQNFASFPRECSVDVARNIDTARTNLMANYYKCNVFQILEDIGTVSVESAKYIYNTYTDSSEILGEVLACTSAGFNPITFIFCIYKAIKTIPYEIKEIVELTKEYESTLDDLVPKIDHAIESCFNKTCNGYDEYLNNVMEVVNLCGSG